MFYMGFNYLKGVDFFSRTNRYYVIYKDVGGLTKSNPVNISGFNIGRVAEISLSQTEGNIVLVALDINSNIILGDSAIATLDANFLGDVSIVINVGDIAKPLAPFDTLYSRVDPGLAELFKQSTQPITDNLPATIANLNALLEDFQGSGEGIKKALASFSATSNSINNMLKDNRAGIRDVVTELGYVTKNLNATIDEVKPLIAKFNILADSLNNLNLSSSVDGLNNLLDEVTITVAALHNKEGTFGKLMYEDSLYQNLNKALLDLDSLLIHINANPKHFFGPLGKSKKKIEKEKAREN